MKKGRIMKAYSKDKTLKILFSLMIVGLFLNFFKPMLKDALAADIDCLIMKDELMEEIQVLKNDIAFSSETLAKLVTVNTFMAIDIAHKGLNMNKDEVVAMYKEHREAIMNF